MALTLKPVMQAQKADMVTRPNPAASPSVPQPLALVHRRLAVTKRTIAAFATSTPLMTGSCELGTNTGFVRPDCPPDLGEQVETAVSKTGASSTARQSYGRYLTKPKFKSALEQVSFLTNDKLHSNGNDRSRQPRLGFFGL